MTYEDRERLAIRNLALAVITDKHSSDTDKGSAKQRLLEHAPVEPDWSRLTNDELAAVASAMDLIKKAYVPG